MDKPQSHITKRQSDTTAIVELIGLLNSVNKATFLQNHTFHAIVSLHLMPVPCHVVV